MSRFSRIFKRCVQFTIAPSLIYSTGVVVNNIDDKNNDDDEDCDTPICHDATDAISKYSWMLNKNKTKNRKYLVPPPDRQKLGRHSWTLLHTLAAYWPNNPTNKDKENILDFLNLLSELYPCKQCAADLKDELQLYPPKVNNRKEFVEWICNLHNRINKKLHKPTFDCKNHQTRWKREHDYTWHDIKELEEQGDIELDDDDYV